MPSRGCTSSISPSQVSLIELHLTSAPAWQLPGPPRGLRGRSGQVHYRPGTAGPAAERLRHHAPAAACRRGVLTKIQHGIDASRPSVPLLIMHPLPRVDEVRILSQYDNLVANRRNHTRFTPGKRTPCTFVSFPLDVFARSCCSFVIHACRSLRTWTLTPARPTSARRATGCTSAWRCSRSRWGETWPRTRSTTASPASSCGEN